MISKKSKREIVKNLFSSEEEKRATALHEAAQAVVFYSLGVPIDYVDIDLKVTTDSDGLIDVKTGQIKAGIQIPSERFEAAARGDADAFEFIKKAITCIIAGAVYDMTETGDCISSHAYKDAGDLSLRACGENLGQAKALVYSCVQDSLKILKDNDAAVERIADALLSEGRLDGSDVEQLMKG